jgi:hypothetical protein
MVNMTLFPLEQAPATSNSADTSSSIKPKPTEPPSPDVIATSNKSQEKETPMDTSDDDQVMRPQARPPMPGRDSVSSRAGARDDGW